MSLFFNTPMSISLPLSFIFPSTPLTNTHLPTQTNTTKTLMGPTTKDASATYAASTSALVQLSTSMGVSWMGYDSSSGIGTGWTAVKALPAVSLTSGSSGCASAGVSSMSSGAVQSSGSAGTGGGGGGMLGGVSVRVGGVVVWWWGSCGWGLCETLVGHMHGVRHWMDFGHAYHEGKILWTDGVKTARIYTYSDGFWLSIFFLFFSSFPLVISSHQRPTGYMAVHSSGREACEWSSSQCSLDVFSVPFFNYVVGEASKQKFSSLDIDSHFLCFEGFKACAVVPFCLDQPNVLNCRGLKAAGVVRDG